MAQEPCELVLDTWAMPPRLDHTFYPPRGTELELAVQAEMKRIVEVMGLGERGSCALNHERGELW